MSLRDLPGCFPVILILLILAVPSYASGVKEDTAHLSFKKTAVSKEKLHSYVVERGDIVSNIIRVQLGVAHGDIYRILKIVKRLNPKIKNINRIRPGQTLTLPGRNVLKTARRGSTAATGEEISGKATPFMPIENHMPVIRHMINRLDGSVTTAGNYYIPIPPAGQVTINCSMVPVVELDDGSRILLDFSSQIPEDLNKMIESTWKNYSIVNKRGIFSALRKIIDISKSHSFKKFGKYVKVGETPRIRILLDWLVSNKISDEGKPCLHGLNLVKDRSRLLPLPIKRYAEKNDLTITEIIEKSGVASATDEDYPALHFPTINSGTNRELADSLLTTLGYTPARNVEVKIFDSAKDGFDLSVNADLLLMIEGGCVIINLTKLPQQFINIFQKMGTKIIFISESEEKKRVTQKVLDAMNIPFIFGNFKFSIPEKAHKPRTIIHIPAIKVTKNKDYFCHLVDFNIDREIQELLHRKWGVNLIKY